MKKQYIYSFDRFAGDDRVFVLENGQKLWIGDLFRIENSYFLNLWEDIAWQDKHKVFWKSEITNLNLVKKWFISAKTLWFIHFLVYQYYSVYRKFVPLFVNTDIEKTLKYDIYKPKTSKYQEVIFDMQNFKLDIWAEKLNWQQLVVFPDLWTMENLLDNKKFKDIETLISSNTQTKKDKIYWQIKNGCLGTLFCTYSQIFQDWRNLKNIILIDGHKRYYKNQQEPRYYVPTVLSQMSKIYWANFQKFGYKLNS